MAHVHANAADWRRERNPGGDAVRMLAAVTRWRWVVGVGALGFGLLLRPDVPVAVRLTLLGAGLVTLTLVTGVYALLNRVGVQPTALGWLMVFVDCALVTAVAAATGGTDSQFVLLYVVVVLWAGVVLETNGGLVAAVVASTGYLCLSQVASVFSVEAWHAAPGVATTPVKYSPVLVGYLLALGAAAGALGGRARRTRQTLALASKEVERARLDTDHILENMPSGVLTIDATGTVLHCNRSAYELLGLPVTMVRGRWCEDAFGDGQKPFLARIMASLETGQVVNREEVLVRTRDGREVPVGLSTAFLTDEEDHRRGVIAVFADLSEFKAVEERARRAETLAAIGQLSAGIAHEIRNCLNPISGSVEYLQRELVLDGESAHLMSLISGECERLNRFVTELLEYAREPRFRLEAVLLSDIVGDALDLVRRHPAWRPEIALVFDDEAAGTDARIDREQLKRVLVNVLQNALESIEGPGKVTVRTRMLSTSRVAVEVADTGTGIAPENLARVTEPFFTTKRGGTGLGLALATRILERLGGRLLVASQPGQGTTFTLELECAATLAHAA